MSAGSPSGYNAQGQVTRYQDAAGVNINTSLAYRYLLGYASAGRPSTVVKETEATRPVQTTIRKSVYDRADHGTASGSASGRLTQLQGYDDTGNMNAQSDFYYQDTYGRLNQVKTIYDAWDGVPSNMTASNTGDQALSTYYQYDDLDQISSITYPNTGSPVTPCPYPPPNSFVSNFVLIPLI